MTELAEKTFQAKLSDGRNIERGQTFRITGRKGWFRFLYSHDNGDLTLWGPAGSQQAQFTSIKPDQLGAMKPIKAGQDGT